MAKSDATTPYLKLSCYLVALQLSFFVFLTPLSAKGAVATGHPLATKVGLEILEKSGNAFDAAVAIASTLGVVQPAMCGIGGYGTILIYDAQKKEVRFLNASGKFPLASNSDCMRAGAPDYLAQRAGPKSISTPGILNAWQEMHQQYGTLPWSTLFEPAIDYAKKGFPLTPYIAKLIAASFEAFPEEAKAFYGKEGRPLKEGEILVQADLGKTFEIIAAEGVDPFYRGRIAEQMAAQLQEIGSFLSLEDLRADIAEWWDPIKLTYKGYDIYTMGTPGNGFSALVTLGIMEQFHLPTLERHDALHLLIEALKRACHARLVYAGHPEQRDHIVHHLLTPENFVTLASSIDPEIASSFEPHPGGEGMNTTHFVVIDQWGNIVSSTETLGLGFGSKVMIKGRGIWMNNSMAFATFEPRGNPMDVFPGKYKLSSNSPVIIFKDHRPWAALGTPGGHTIPQNVAQIILNLIDYHMTMQEAIDEPKLAFFEEDGVVCIEPTMEESVVASLLARGHKIEHQHLAHYLGLNGKIGDAMGIKMEETTVDVGIDHRKDGWSIMTDPRALLSWAELP